MSIPIFNLFSVNGSDGFRLDGEHADDRLGYFVSSAGDVNGDGFEDVIIGAPWVDNGTVGDGSSYVVFGKVGGFDAALPLSALDGSNGFRLDGGHQRFTYGDSVSNAGDINGDGFDDVIIKGTEASYVVFGRASGFDAQIDLSSLNGNNGFRLEGEKGLSFHFQSQSLNGAVDVNGDGFDDVIVESVYRDQNNRYLDSSYVIFGHAADFDATIDLSALDGNAGFRLSDMHDFGKLSVTGVSDINGDDLDDLLVTADSAYNNSNYGSGGDKKNYVVYGKAAGFAAVEDPADLDGKAGCIWIPNWNRLAVLAISMAMVWLIWSWHGALPFLMTFTTMLYLDRHPVWIPIWIYCNWTVAMDSGWGTCHFMRSSRYRLKLPAM